MPIFDAGRAMLDAAFSFAAEPMTYKRGSQTLAQGVPAKRAKTIFDRESLYAGTGDVRFCQGDFLVRAADLATDPALNDCIEIGAEKWRVCAPLGEPCWRWHDPTTRRVHALREA
ncbi:MAG: hypothetical protein J6P03_03430 [Opitutales bacterium]|nr:hypothetical protein [Opitutales bacterium]